MRELEEKRKELEELKTKTRQYLEKLKKERDEARGENKELSGFLEKRRNECNQLRSELEQERVGRFCHWPRGPTKTCQRSEMTPMPLPDSSRTPRYNVF
jgi:hypothetical protein